MLACAVILAAGIGSQAVCLAIQDNSRIVSARLAEKESQAEKKLSKDGYKISKKQGIVKKKDGVVYKCKLYKSGKNIWGIFYSYPAEAEEDWGSELPVIADTFVVQ